MKKKSSERGFRSASAKPDGRLKVRYKNGYVHKEGRWAYLNDKPLSERELRLWG